jgi:hypothetical protein
MPRIAAGINSRIKSRKIIPPAAGARNRVLEETWSSLTGMMPLKAEAGARSCDAPVAEGAGDASSPEPATQPNGMFGLSRDEGVAPTFCDGASQLHVAATASFRAKQQGIRGRASGRNSERFQMAPSGFGSAA